MLRALLCLIGAGLLSACASLPAPPPAWQRWSARQGGIETGRTARAAEAALARLAAACACPEIRVRVLDNDRTEAFAWRDGSIFVTRGLVGALLPEELAAAIAHEIAHVRDEVAVEAEADRIGIELLRASGLAPAHMAGMLAKLVSASAPDRRIGARIAALAGDLGPGGAPARDLVALLD
jgi:Zn-dependent protease with chaperone function